VDPDQVAGVLDGIADRASVAASPAVLAMAHTFERAVKRTLSLRTRGMHDFRNPGERGQAPAMRSGALRSSVTSAGGGGAPVAEASVAPHVFYAGIQEWGGEMHARPGGYMHFISGGEWFLKEVHVGPNPYMRPTLVACIGNGSLGRAAAQAFEIAVWGR
jgi:phage gpG-like protein